MWQCVDLRLADHIFLHFEDSIIFCGLPQIPISIIKNLKGQCHEIFCFWFFYESVTPQPQSIPLGPFRIFSKIRGDIRSSRLTTGVADTGGK